MFNIIIGCFCLLIAILLMYTSPNKEDAKFILFSIIIGVINLSLGLFLYFNKDTYIITITQKNGTAIEFETKDYDVEDTYIKVKQNDGYIYVYEIKNIKVEKEDR